MKRYQSSDIWKHILYIFITLPVLYTNILKMFQNTLFWIVSCELLMNVYKRNTVWVGTRYWSKYSNYATKQRKKNLTTLDWVEHSENKSNEQKKKIKKYGRTSSRSRPLPKRCSVSSRINQKAVGKGSSIITEKRKCYRLHLTSKKLWMNTEKYSPQNLISMKHTTWVL